MASQAGYGLMISSSANLPPLNADLYAWELAIDKIVVLSYIVADKQIAHSRKKRRK